MNLIAGITDKPGPAICIFAYKRPDHLRKVLKALAGNQPAASLPLIVFVDGPRNHSDQPLVNDVIAVSRQAFGFESVQVRLRNNNLGLYISLTNGISEVLSEYSSVIVIEDDILVSPHFLRFMLDALELYRDIPEVASIHGFTPPIRNHLPDTFFLRGADCWGWATWRDRWQLFRHDAGAMAMEIIDRGLVYEFDLLGSYPYLEMLKGRASGANNSWAICWHASCFLPGKLTLYPGKSLVSNIGLDNSGEHCGPSPMMSIPTFGTQPVVVSPIPLEVDQSLLEVYSAHFMFNQYLFSRMTALFVLFLKRAKRRFLSRLSSGNIKLIGPYDSYDDALHHSTGYDSSVVVGKVEYAVRSVLDGTFKYERDGTAFTEKPKGLPIEAILKQITPQVDRIIDFGGGLGGMFISYSEYFDSGAERYVVEQPSFLERGRVLSSEYALNLNFTCIDDLASLHQAPTLLVLSCVLMYVNSWETLLGLLISVTKPEYIFVDRQGIYNRDSDGFYVQSCGTYYASEVSYPFTLLSRRKFLNFFSAMGYRLVRTGKNPLHTGWPSHYFFLFTTRD
jgi:putative methyltransferase (TIGR04325 family)